MAELRAKEELEKFLKEFDENTDLSAYAHETISKRIVDILEILAGETSYIELYHVVKNMDNRLQRIEDMVETVAKEVGPIVAELAESPVIKMLTGGKKRG